MELQTLSLLYAPDAIPRLSQRLLDSHHQNN